MAELTMDNIPFLQNQDTETLHKEMLDCLPSDLDKTEGGFAHDFTYPTALRVAKYAEQDLLNVIGCIFPQFAVGEFLDFHGDNGRGMTRKPATKSYGYVQVLAKAGTTIPKGAVFTTMADVNTEYVEFVSVEAGTTESDTQAIEIAVEATTAGIEGNVSANTIVMLGTYINGVISVTNAEPTTGGTNVEDDESFRERILTLDRTRSVSFVGSISDYERWALEVAGVGAATVIPAQDDSGLVTIILTDANGEPANEQLRQAVYNHIQSPDNEKARLSNVNSLLSVVAPETMTITVSATIEVLETSTLENVKTAFITALKQYLIACDGEVKRSKVGQILSATVGVNDYTNLLINGGESNVAVSTNQIPFVAENSVTLVEGVVE